MGAKTWRYSPSVGNIPMDKSFSAEVLIDAIRADQKDGNKQHGKEYLEPFSGVDAFDECKVQEGALEWLSEKTFETDTGVLA